MFTWKKLGKVFDPTMHPGRNWMAEFAQAPSALLFKDFVRVYFSCRSARDRNGQYISYSAFADFKRSNLLELTAIASKPILSLGHRGEFDEFGTYPVSVIRHNNDIIAYYGGWTRCESVPFNVAIGIARSTDEGISFQKPGHGPVISYSPGEPFVMSGPKIRIFNGQWYLFYIAGRRWIKTNGIAEPVYKIRMAVSGNGLDWIKADLDLIPDKLGADEAQASPDVFYYQGRYHMFFCYRHGLDYRNKERGYRIGYAYSDDLKNWIRDDTQAGLDVSVDGWDSEMLSYPHVFELDGKLYMYYLGDQVGRRGFGLAELVGYSL